MPEEIKILIVENEKNDIQTYLDIIKTINQEQSSFILAPTIKETKDSGLEALESNDWAAAFIDLKLSTGDILNAQEGNEIVSEIYKKRRFPIYILTNTPEDVSKEFAPSIFLKVASKADVDYDQVFKEVIKIYKTGILNILGKKGVIEKYLDDIFWNHISNSMNYWMETSDERTLLRYTLNHLIEYLDLNANDESTFELYVPAEFYITPPVKKQTFTGDIIVDSEGKYSVILNPACDMDFKEKAGVKFRKADYILLIKTHGIREMLSLDAQTNQLSNGKKTELKKLRSMPRYYYLPKYNSIPALFIDFQKKSVIEDSELNKQIEEGSTRRIATIASSFLKDLINQYSSYYARQGAPDFDEDFLFNDDILT